MEIILGAGAAVVVTVAPAGGRVRRWISTAVYSSQASSPAQASRPSRTAK